MNRIVRHRELVEMLEPWAETSFIADIGDGSVDVAASPACTPGDLHIVEKVQSL